MTTKLALIGLLGAGAVAAAAGGGYVALRRNAIDRPPAAIATAATPNVPADTSEVPVGPPAAVIELPPRDEKPVAAERRVTSPKTAEPSHTSRSPRPEPSRPAPSQSATSRPAASRPATKATTSDPAPAATVPSTPVPSSPSSSETASSDLKNARTEPAAIPAYEPPAPRLEELTVAPDSVIGIRLESAISSETAKVEDKVTARVTRDVTVDGKTAIASGARLDGVVASVERGGKFKDRARIGIRFQSLVLADGTRLPVETETIFRESDSPTGSAASKVGASAAVGGILGAVLGGKKGAAIGATVGGAGGSAVVMAGAPATAVIPAGTPLTVRLTEPLTVRVQKEN